MRNMTLFGIRENVSTAKNKVRQDAYYITNWMKDCSDEDLEVYIDFYNETILRKWGKIFSGALLNSVILTKIWKNEINEFLEEINNWIQSTINERPQTQPESNKIVVKGFKI